MNSNNFEEFNFAIVRIYHKTTERVVGAGFLISPKYILTCAHVVAQALNISSETPEVPEESVVEVDFPLVAPGNKQQALVSFWLPSQAISTTPPKQGEDVAVLKMLSLPLEVTKQVQPVPILLAEDPKTIKDPFYVFGFPSGHDNGVWASGEISGPQAWGWVGMEAIKVPGFSVEPGFSGAPVWDEKLGAVVGMATAAERKRKDVKAAFMIPTKKLQEWVPDHFLRFRIKTQVPNVHPQCLPIVEDFAEGKDIVPFLGSGINLCDGDISSPINLIRLASNLVKNSNQFIHKDSPIVLGVPCLEVPSAVCPLPPDKWPPPANCPFWNKTTRKKIQALSNNQKLAFSKVNIRLISQWLSYYSGGHLYQALHNLWDDDYQQFQNSSRLRRIHDFFANLRRKISQKKEPDILTYLPYKLIVTTNFDETLEQAFDHAGLKGHYDVVFYVAEGDDRGHFKHKDNQGNIHTIPFSSDSKLKEDSESSEYKGLPIGQRPIILKLYGTWEHEFVITEEHHVTYLVDHSIEEALPKALYNLLRDSTVLFLGYSPYDNDLLTVLHRIWKDQSLKQSKSLDIQSWLVHKSEPVQLEKQFLKDRNIEAIEMPLAEFITNLEMGLERYKFH